MKDLDIVEIIDILAHEYGWSIEYIENLGLDEMVLFLGKRAQNTLPYYYSAAEVVVMPSFYEPFGIVFAEAMAHKLPCIGGNSCAIPEIIDNEKTGFIVPPGNSKILGKISIAEEKSIYNNYYLKIVAQLFIQTKWYDLFHLDIMETMDLEYSQYIYLKKLIEEYERKYKIANKDSLSELEKKQQELLKKYDN